MLSSERPRFLCHVALNRETPHALVMSHYMTEDDRFGWVKGLSVSVGFLGVVVTLWFSGLGLSKGAITGVLAALLAACCFSLGGVLTRRLDSAPADGVALSVFLVGTATMLPLSLWLEGVPSTRSWQSVLTLLYLGACSTGLAFLIRFRLIASAGYSFASNSGYIIPAVGLLLGGAYLDEYVNPMVVIGLAITLVGIWMRRWG